MKATERNEVVKTEVQLVVTQDAANDRVCSHLVLVDPILLNGKAVNKLRPARAAEPSAAAGERLLVVRRLQLNVGEDGLRGCILREADLEDLELGVVLCIV